MYECHLTYENVTSGVETVLCNYAAKYGWKTSYIMDDPALGPGKRFFLTMHHDDKALLYALMQKAAMSPELPEPAREKIEHIIHDTKYNVTLAF